MTKPKSRSRRWADAISVTLQGLSDLEERIDAIESSLSDLRSLQEEYEKWKDNLPENLANSPLGEKLEEVCNLEIEDAAQSIRDAIEEVKDKVEEADGIDLPQSFGRD